MYCPERPYYGYAYDIMGRLSTMTNVTTSLQVVTGTTFDPANRLLSIAGNALNETREYNTIGQLTQIISSAVSGSSLNITYNYSSTQNNGKITSQTDNISGEQVVYAYDSLNRLASAAATNSSWGQSYAYDGFGNLTNQTVTAGSAPPLSVVYNASTNRRTDDCADANGNINAAPACGSSGYGYDVENRLHPPVPSGVGSFYSYAPGNKRVWRGTLSSNSTITLDEVTFWSVTGQKLATYSLLGGGATLSTANAYFGGRLIANNTGNVATDRLGSVGKYYPWGQLKPTGNVVGTEGFTGYFRDTETGLDYAKARYHQPGMGRFLSPDPYMAKSGGKQNPVDPGSWNKYAYVGGDPVNFRDPSGRARCDPGAGDCGACDPFDPEGDCGDPDPGPGGPGGGPGTPDPPSLTCGLSGPPQTPLGGISDVTGPTGFTATSLTAMAEFSFSASGGTGGYTFSVSQTISEIGFIEYSNGDVIIQNYANAKDVLLPTELQQSGANATFTDEPGLWTKENGTGPATLFFATDTKSFTTTITVTSGSQQAQCSVSWSASFSWLTLPSGLIVPSAQAKVNP